MQKESFTPKDYFIFLITGTAEYFGMVCSIYSASIGVGGIAFAIANTCCIYTSLFNYLVMSQALTLAQILGIILTLGGSTVIALEEDILKLAKRGA